MSVPDGPSATAEAIRREASRYLAFDLGVQLSPGDPVYDPADEQWRVPIHSRRLGTVPLGHLILDTGARVRRAPSREELAQSATGARFCQHMLSLPYAAASEGERILVADTGAEVKASLVDGPQIGPDGVVHCRVHMEGDALEELPEEFRIDLVFMPTLGVLVSRVCGPEERQQLLQPFTGLDLSAPLPGFAPLAEQLRHVLNEEHLDRIWLPRLAFALLIRWTSRD